MKQEGWVFLPLVVLGTSGPGTKAPSEETFVLSRARYYLGSFSTPSFLEELLRISVPRAFQCYFLTLLD